MSSQPVVSLGEVYGCLKIIGKLARDETLCRSSIWQVKCKCGNVYATKSSHLKSIPQKCGKCRKFDFTKVGQKFGQRIVIEAGYPKSRCRCKCGSELWVSNHVLRNGKAKMCIRCVGRANGKPITFEGKTKCLKGWAQHLDIPVTTLDSRINKHGWPLERALNPARDTRGRGDVASQFNPMHGSKKAQRLRNAKSV